MNNLDKEAEELPLQGTQSPRLLHLGSWSQRSKAWFIMGQILRDPAISPFLPETPLDSLLIPISQTLRSLVDYLPLTLLVILQEGVCPGFTPRQGRNRSALAARFSSASMPKPSECPGRTPGHSIALNLGRPQAGRGLDGPADQGTQSQPGWGGG